MQGVLCGSTAVNLIPDYKGIKSSKNLNSSIVSMTWVNAINNDGMVYTHEQLYENVRDALARSLIIIAPTSSSRTVS